MCVCKPECQHTHIFQGVKHVDKLLCFVGRWRRSKLEDEGGRAARHIPPNSAQKYTDGSAPRAARTRLQLDWNQPEGSSCVVTDRSLASVPLVL